MGGIEDDDDLRVKDWWLYQELHAGTRETRVELERGESARAVAAWRAWDQVDEAIAAGGVAALELILALLRAGPVVDKRAAIVGTGPLELLVHQHGEDLCDAIRALARREPAFGQALRSVWLERGTLSPEAETTLARWVRLTGTD